MNNLSAGRKPLLSLLAGTVGATLGLHVAEVYTSSRLKELPPDSPERIELQKERSNWADARLGALCLMSISGLGAMATIVRDERRRIEGADTLKNK